MAQLVMFMRKKAFYLFLSVFIIVQGVILFSAKWQRISEVERDDNLKSNVWEEVFTGCVK